MDRKRRQIIRQLQDTIVTDTLDSRLEFKEKLARLRVEDINSEYRLQTPLRCAVREGGVWFCDALLSKGANVDDSDAEENSVLHIACRLGREDIVKTLIKHGANLDARNRLGYTPLCTCAEQGYLPLVKLLLAAGADCDIASEKRETPLHLAAQEGHVDLIKCLLEVGNCDVNAPDVNMRTPLIAASESGNVDVVSALLTYGSKRAGEKININFGKNVGPAIFSAIYNRHFAIVKELIQHGADLNLKIKGTCPLACAVSEKAVDIAELLIQSGCDLNVTDVEGQTPLYIAVNQVMRSSEPEKTGLPELIRKMVAAGADVNKANKEGRTVLHLVVAAGDSDLFNLLLQHGADVMAATELGDTVLHEATRGSKVEIVKCLLQKGCPPNKTNKAGYHALHTAVGITAPLEIVKALVEGGSDINLQEKENGNTPLHQAIFYRYFPAALYLIDSGSDLELENRGFQTSLYLACRRGHTEVVERILAGLGPRLLDCNPCALPIHVAAAEGHHRLVRRLIEVGYDINEMAVTGMTPLLTALSEDNAAVCAVLLELGASLTAHRARPRILTTCCQGPGDRHPHFHLEPLFLAMQHKNPAMMRTLLQCSPALPANVLKSLRDILLRNADVRGQFPARMREEILALIHKALTQPRPLLELCRGPVRAVVGCPLRQRLIQILGPNASLVPNFVCMSDTMSAIVEEYEQSRVSFSTIRNAVV